MRERQPFPIKQTPDREAVRRLFNVQAGRVDKYNVLERGLDVGTTLTHNAPAGRLDGVYCTISFGSSASATQVGSIIHGLGRAPIGFEVVNRNGPVQVYSNTASTANATAAYFGALFFGSGTVTATVRIW